MDTAWAMGARSMTSCQPLPSALGSRWTQPRNEAESMAID